MRRGCLLVISILLGLVSSALSEEVLPHYPGLWPFDAHQDMVGYAVELIREEYGDRYREIYEFQEWIEAGASLLKKG